MMFNDATARDYVTNLIGAGSQRFVIPIRLQLEAPSF